MRTFIIELYLYFILFFRLAPEILQYEPISLSTDMWYVLLRLFLPSYCYPLLCH